jgi:hypothetical protein
MLYSIRTTLSNFKVTNKWLLSHLQCMCTRNGDANGSAKRRILHSALYVSSLTPIVSPLIGSSLQHQPISPLGRNVELGRITGRAQVMVIDGDQDTLPAIL